jgi:hypothetical protein
MVSREQIEEVLDGHIDASLMDDVVDDILDVIVKYRELTDDMAEKIDEAVGKELKPSDGGGTNPLSVMLSDYRTESARKKAKEKIRLFRSDESLNVTFTEVAINPYLNGCRSMEIYEDDNGFEYWVDQKNDHLIQCAPSAMMPAKSYDVDEKSRVKVSALRAKAKSIVTSIFPAFMEMESKLAPLEDNRNKTVYFFRWDDMNTKIPDSELPPFLQVGIRANGDLVSYTNTLRAA